MNTQETTSVGCLPGNVPLQQLRILPKAHRAVVVQTGHHAGSEGRDSFPELLRRGHRSTKDLEVGQHSFLVQPETPFASILPKLRETSNGGCIFYGRRTAGSSTPNNRAVLSRSLWKTEPILGARVRDQGPFYPRDLGNDGAFKKSLILPEHSGTRFQRLDSSRIGILQYGGSPRISFDRRMRPTGSESIETALSMIDVAFDS